MLRSLIIPYRNMEVLQLFELELLFLSLDVLIFDVRKTHMTLEKFIVSSAGPRSIIVIYNTIYFRRIQLRSQNEYEHCYNTHYWQYYSFLSDRVNILVYYNM